MLGGAPIKILIIAPEQIPVPPVKGGSVEICILAIARRLAKSHKVTVISKKTSKYPNKTQDGNLTIERVDSGSPATYLRAVLAKIKGRHFDMIQVDNRPRSLPKIKKMFPSTPLSLFLHSLTFVSSPQITRQQAAQCMQYADVIIANSQSLKSELQHRYPKIKNRLKVVYLGTDVQRFRPPTVRERNAVRAKLGVSSAYVVTFAGRIIPRKGLPVLIRAIQQAKKSVPNVQLLVAGNTQRKGYGAKMKKLAAQLNVPMKMAGYYAHKRMHQFYWAGDCFVCPSQKHEAFGLVNIEAMAAGLPVVASDIGGIREIIRHEKNGILIKRFHQPSAFATAIQRLATQQKLTKSIRRTGLKDVKHRFSWQGTADRLIKLYHKHQA
ncbi:glycosyltransferase family 4 protein [Paenibacillus guangzhouensis]|uniref:glycosyltransferase family 4 protein n=1 Tax=Paenibacillus guangzhouensis TaxID=1473112 RepID=UPI001D123256|nr:glycosyltransferase family 4 protein [Paenibacillus guangzhouensis]